MTLVVCSFFLLSISVHVHASNLHEVAEDRFFENQEFVDVDIQCKIRDWSLITGRGGDYKMGKSRVRNFLRPPPQDKVKLFAPPPPISKECKHFDPPTIWLKLQATA